MHGSFPLCLETVRALSCCAAMSLCIPLRLTTVLRPYLQHNVNRFMAVSKTPFSSNNALAFLANFARATQNGVSKKVCKPFVDDLLHHSEHLGAAASGIKAAIDARNPLLVQQNPEWRNFFKQYDDRDRGSFNLRARLTAIWTREVMEHYGWDDENQGMLNDLYTCAKAWPNFEQFVQFANCILIDRHEAFIVSKGQSPIGFQRSSHSSKKRNAPLRPMDATKLASWAKGGDVTGWNGTTFPQQPTSEMLSKIEEWNTDSDGSICVDGRSIYDIGRHHPSTCVASDKYGLLVPEAGKFLQRPPTSTLPPCDDAVDDNPTGGAPVYCIPTCEEGAEHVASQDPEYPAGNHPAGKHPLGLEKRRLSASVDAAAEKRPCNSVLRAAEPGLHLDPLHPSPHTPTTSTTSPCASPLTPTSTTPDAVRRGSEDGQDAAASSVASALTQPSSTQSEQIVATSGRNELLPHEKENLIMQAWEASKPVSQFVKRVDIEEFLSYLSSGGELYCVYVVSEEFADTNLHTEEDYFIRLCRFYPKHDIDVRCSSATTERMSVQKFVDGRRSYQKKTQHSRAPPNNALNLRPICQAYRPQFLQIERLQLLNALVERARMPWNQGPGKRHVYDPFDVASCLGFDILGYGGLPPPHRDAVSLPHVDSLTGTWVRCVFGEKEWFVVDPNLMSEQDWQDFATEPNTWKPGNKATRIHLKPNETLVMPPGLRIIHAVRTKVTCLMTGGMFWDTLSVIKTLENVLWVCRNQGATNEDIALQLPNILEQLKEWIVREPSVFSPLPGTKTGFKRRFLKLYQAFKDLGCKCQKCDGSNAKDCHCWLDGRKCTEWCHEEVNNEGRAKWEDPPTCFVGVHDARDGSMCQRTLLL